MTRQPVFRGQWRPAVLGTVLLFFSALGFTELKHAKFLIYLGKISYGLYVFHILGTRIALRIPHPRSPGADRVLQWVIALAATFVLAHLSYRYFESTFLRLKDRFTIIKSRSI